MRVLLAVLATVLSATTLAAQQISGIVRDSTAASPVAGAVVSLMDSAGALLSRGISNERGEYRIPWFSQGRSMRITRIGYQPRVERWTPEMTTRDVRMARIPILLQPVTVRAAGSCPPRKDRLQAFSLLEQARAGLLTTIVAREMNPATSMFRLTYAREMDGNSDKIVHQAVQQNRQTDQAHTFAAVHSGAEFVDSGFTMRDQESLNFYGPDADVIIDDGFANAYCFRVVNGARDHREQIGLAFEPATHKDGRVDLVGSIWIDTLAHALARIDYAYTGMELPAGAVQPNGYTSFHEMPNGVVFVDRWRIRMFAKGADSVWRDRVQVETDRYFTQESGGELASATWSDGSSWRLPLGTLRLKVTGGGAPLPRATLRLDDTDYRATSDSAGVVTIPELLPGPYAGTVLDTLLRSPMVSVSAPVRFDAVGDSIVQHAVDLPASSRIIRQACLARPQPPVWGLATIASAVAIAAPRDTVPITIVRVVGREQEPVDGATVALSIDLGGGVRVTEIATTGSSGLVQSCVLSKPGAQIHAAARRGTATSDEFVFTVASGLRIFRITLDEPRR